MTTTTRTERTRRSLREKQIRMVRRAAVGALLLVGAVVMVLAVRSLVDAYGWVSHTSDVRVVIGKALGAVSTLEDPRACAVMSSSIDDFARLTVDNHAQQERVAELRPMKARACAGDEETATQIQRTLNDADAMERSLLLERRLRLERTAKISLGLFFSTTLLAMVIALTSAIASARATQALAVSEERFRMLAESATDLIRVHEPSGKVLYSTPSCVALLGRTVEETLAAAPFDLVHPDEQDDVRNIALSLTRGVRMPPIKHRLRLKDGSFRWFETMVQPVFDASGAVARYYTTSRDVHERVVAQEKLETLTITDELTKLHNRRGFTLLAGYQHALAMREARSLVVLFADLDGLKPINDELGHEQGDAAIRDFAQLLRMTFRASDVVARMGGDEFAALAFDVPEEDAKRIEARIHEGIASFNAKAQRPYALATSIGLATMNPNAPKSLDELVADADARMYEQKRQRKDVKKVQSQS